VLEKRRKPRPRSIGVVLLGIGICAGLLVVPRTDPASAHSWFPMRCCGGQDCRKVDKIDFLPDGDMIMHVGYMEVLVPRSFLKERSEDADAHVCVSIATGTYRPICVFLPGTS